MKKQFSYKIKKRIAVLSEEGTITTELNMISFCGAPVKYDLRRWRTADGIHQMQKGLTLSVNELRMLRDTLNALDLDP